MAMSHLLSRLLSFKKGAQVRKIQVNGINEGAYDACCRKIILNAAIAPSTSEKPQKGRTGQARFDATQVYAPSTAVARSDQQYCRNFCFRASSIGNDFSLRVSAQTITDSAVAKQLPSMNSPCPSTTELLPTRRTRLPMRTWLG